jgi:2'-hydroxyisoflavone reductase
MRMLILGGTVFLGRHLVAAAQACGHTVTIFHRGQHAADLPAGVTEILGDRTASFDALAGSTWDAVIDTSGYVPRHVRRSAEYLAERAQHYTFISTLSVFAEGMRPGADEDAPLAPLSDPTTEEVTNETYGALKALCEQAVTQTLPERALVIRPGLIVGPYDPTDRFTYWPHRIAQGGEVLAPDGPEHRTQFIDARDLAEWTVRMAEGQQTGIFNATGPEHPLTFGELFAACRAVSGSDARFTWVSEAFLAEQGVAPWSDLPLWVPNEMAAFNGETVRATLAWDRTRPADHTWKAGLAPERERAVLAAWHT